MLDTFGREITYLRLSVTEMCDLRCRYCMPPEGICKKSHSDMLSQEEMLMAVQAAAELGVRKVRITGGEPLVKKNILSICEQTAKVSGIEQLCITTNAQRLASMAAELKAAGVSCINISLDTLDTEKYRYITRVGELDRTLTGIDAALNAGFEKLKINAVLIGGFNDDEIRSLALLTLRYPVDVRFIELMPMENNEEFEAAAYIPGSRVLKELPELQQIKNVDVNAPSELYRLPSAQGNVGVIHPISQHFCRNCNRIRITADGKVKPCLHKPAEYSIKGLSFEEMKKQLIRAVAEKPEWHGELSAESRSEAGRAMHRIGG